MGTVSPQQDLETLAQWGTDNLTQVIAIDSQSDEDSADIPSSEGQRVLSNFLRAYFENLGLATAQDAVANLLVTIPANLGPEQRCPSIALMVHMDTAEGTRAVPALELAPAWDGSAVHYPDNHRLTVSAERYPELAGFVGDDVLHGPGSYPIGLDDKLGMAELMTSAQVLIRNPDIRHGELTLVFRPDEEIGRMAAVEGLADELARRGVRYGYTIDGIVPFEINVENFNAAAAKVEIAGAPRALPVTAMTRTVQYQIKGVKTHGATAKAEGHLNAIVVVTRAMVALGQRDDIILTDLRTDSAVECTAVLTALVCGDNEAELERTQAALYDALSAEIEPHAWKGALVEACTPDQTAAKAAGNPEPNDAGQRLVAHIARFLGPNADASDASTGASDASRVPMPLLPEDSDNYQGYASPCRVEPSPAGFVLTYRLRDFDPANLDRRIDYLRAVCTETGIGPEQVTAVKQYINMGPKLAAYPELAEWAGAALREIGQSPLHRPIRGGTGVDPFLARDIPVANLGTGYFAPESEKELTSRQNIARHTHWLVHLVQIIAERSG